MTDVIRIIKKKNFTTLSNFHLQDKNLSLKAKGLLSYMLSLPNDWSYSIQGLKSTLKEGREAIRTTLKELEKYGYLIRNRLRGEHGEFIGGSEYVIYEQPENESLLQENSYGTTVFTAKSNIQTLDKPTYEKSPLQSTYKDKRLKEQNTQSINRAEKIEQVEICNEDEIEGILKENIEYDVLIADPDYFDTTDGKSLLDSIISIMKEPFISKSPTQRIGGEWFATEVVRSRFMTLNCEHIKYVYDCVFANSDNARAIKNIKAYLLTALYNAPITYHAYQADLCKKAV